MIEQVLRRSNLLRAMRKVQKNHGSAGVDHMPVTKLSELMSIDKEELSGKVRSGKYLPQPILGVEIPKGRGKTRLLGIPTVTDRMLQQAVLQVMMARFEFEFSESSFGFETSRVMRAEPIVVPEGGHEAAGKWGLAAPGTFVLAMFFFAWFCGEGSFIAETSSSATPAVLFSFTPWPRT